MKKTFFFLAILAVLVSCEKPTMQYQGNSSERRDPSESVYPTQNNTVICTSVETKGAAVYSGVNELRYVKFEEVLYNENYPEIEITHKPANVQVTFNKKNGSVIPDIWLENEYDDTCEDNYLDFTFVTKGLSVHKYHFTLKRAKVEFSTSYIYDQDSVFVRQDGWFMETPSKNTTYIDRWSQLFKYTIQTNTYAVFSSSEWITYDPYSLGITFAENDNYETRRGYIAVSDVWGEVTDTIRFIQEGTGWQDRQNEVLWELYYATDGPNWKNNDGWVEGMEATGRRAGIGFNDNGRVEQIVLGGNRLKGTLPESFGELWYVHKIDLYDNELSGPIPDCLGKLHCLRELHLENNQLTGGIPESMKGLTRMSALYLGNNKLSGVIPDWIFELPRFVNPPYEGYHLCLGDNYFSNYDPSKHCTHAWVHEDGGNHGGKTPDGFNQGGSVEETF